MYTETLMQYAGERRFLPQPWRQASTISDWHVRLTPERADELMIALVRVIEDFRADEEGTSRGGRLRGQPQRVPAPRHGRPGGR